MNFTRRTMSVLAGSLLFCAAQTVDAADAVLVDASGNVGIGTSSPLADIHVKKSSPKIRLEHTGNNRFGLFYQDGDGTHVASESVGDLMFIESKSWVSTKVNGTEIQTIKSDGVRVGANILLDVSGTATVSGLNLGSGGTNGYWNGASIYGPATGDLSIRPGNAASKLHLGGSSNATHLTIKSNGNVGINITNPSEKLEVNGTVKANKIHLSENVPELKFTHTITNRSGSIYHDNNGFNVQSNLAGDNLYLKSENRIQVDIGTTWRLKVDSSGINVKGSIRIDGSNIHPHPDYVFEDDYDLRSLEQVEAYVAKHKHLPGIVSADDVKKNGLDLTELTVRHLEKIEELTLYAIDADKRIQALAKQNKAIEAKLNELIKAVSQNSPKNISNESAR